MDASTVPEFRRWTKAEDAAIRKHYPRKGPSMGSMMGRTALSTRQRASRLGVKFAPGPVKARVAHREIITESLVCWAERQARAYARRYGDPADRFGSCTSAALMTAHRTYDPRKGVPFETYARWVVSSKLELIRMSSGLSGYRRNGQHPGRDGAPSVFSIAEDDRESDVSPVGWEVDYADYVGHLARTMPGVYGQVIRLIYLECRGATITGAARTLGLSHSRVSEIHSEAIAKLRARIRSPRGPGGRIRG